MTTRIPGLVVTDHTVAVPLDHASPEDGRTIEVFAREVVAAGREHDDLPWLLFLQGGPGGKSPRPGGGPGDGWLRFATRTHRVLLLDQRGTGRSTPVTRHAVEGMTDAEIAAYLRLFRADSIVADAEVLRSRVAGGRTWETLGQSYGGFVTMTYLSQAPEALDACYVTGGLPPIAATADDVYARTYPRVARKNAEFRARHPEDAADHNLPQLYWYAMEPLADVDATRALKLAADAKVPQLLPLMARRIGAIGTPEAVGLLVKAAGESADGGRQLALLRGLQDGLKGKRQFPMPAGWPAR